MNYAEVLAFVVKAHEGQFRRDEVTPYVTHPIAVSELVSSNEEKIVALLHDIIEDTSIVITPSQDGMLLNDLFVPQNIYNTLVLLTHNSHDSYDDYIDKIVTSGNKLAIRVKLADMIHNLSSSPTVKQKQKYLRSIPKLFKVL